MKRIKLLTALALGVVASSSGALQVRAATYNFFVNFDTKEVANFDDFRQSFSIDTYDLDAVTTFYWGGTYRFDSCPTAFTANMEWVVRYRINGSGSFIELGRIALPDFPCTTVNTTYFAQRSLTIPTNLVETLIDDDDDFVELQSRIQTNSNAALNNRILYLLGYRHYFDISYDFNTTYLFNYFLSDQNFQDRNYGVVVPTLNATMNNELQYVYTTAGNDSYYINNSGGADIGTTRKKYAIDYNDEFFRGESVGAGFSSDMTGTDQFLFPASPSNVSFNYNYRYYYLNTANLAQAIVDAPIISFTEEDCSGGFLDVNVGCYVNNALAYIVNDAPVISDAFTLLNTGIELAAQTFGVIGAFSDDNVFGYLILVGFGFIAVKWFLKNDE
jgi:hypothetical protein